MYDSAWDQTNQPYFREITVMRVAFGVLKTLSPALLVLTGLSAGCSETSPPPAEALPETATDESAVLPTSLGTTAPVSRTGDIYLAGQPTVEDIALMKAKGVKTIVSLREEGETDWNEEKIVESAGMKFVRIPFAGADELNANVFEQVRALLRDSETQPLVLHCGGANRVGAVWLPYRVLDQGVPLDEAVREARAAGLQSDDLERKARAYVRRQQAAADESTPASDEASESEAAESPGESELSPEADAAAESGEAASVDDDPAVVQ